MRAVALLALLSPLASACRHATRGAAPAPADDETVRGVSSFRFIPSGSSSRPALPENVEFIPPLALGPLATPDYPGRALRARPDPAAVVVRVVIDTEGRVETVEDSPLGISTPGPFAGEFRTAVEVAVRRWEFSPAMLRELADGDDLDGDGTSDYKRVVDSQAVSVFLDVRFEFEIVEGRGRVRTRPARFRHPGRDLLLPDSACARVDRMRRSGIG